MSLSQALVGPGAGVVLSSPPTRPDRVPLKKGEYSVASRALALSTYFLSGALAINLSQFLGTPLYLVNEDWYNAWIAFTKQSFGLLTMTLTQAFAPTKVIVSGDKSVRGQLLKSTDGNLVLDFPERLVLIANHQIYTDWLYLWWIAYCNRMHGHLYIILKESLKKIPVLGWGMQFSQFIFLKRNWEKDKPHMASALQRLNSRADPMWLLLFPEGTNLAPSTREKSAQWAKKMNMADMQHLLLPRSTGLQFCLEELKGTVEYVYDCTVAYGGVPRGQYAQDIFTLRAGYLEGRPPKSVGMYWRRFAIKDIPLHNQKVFDLWLIARWREKDLLLENYMRTGKFPADVGATRYKSGKILKGCGHQEVQVRSSHWYEFLQIFAPMGVLAMVLAVFYGALPQSFWKSFNKKALQSSTEEIKKVGVQYGQQAKGVSQSAASLTLDDIFDKDKQDESFKKGAYAVQRWLNTPQAQTLMNRVDFVTQFLQNPQKTVAETMTGKQKNFMKEIEEEEARRRRLKLTTSAQNVGPNKGNFWKDLEKLDQSRNGSVVSAPSSTSKAVSKQKGTFWADLKAAEQKKGGLELTTQGQFWDKMKAEENSRYGTVRTLSSNASTAVGSIKSGSSTAASSQKAASVVTNPQTKTKANVKEAVASSKQALTKTAGPQTIKPGVKSVTVPAKKPVVRPGPAASKSSIPNTKAGIPKPSSTPISKSATNPSKHVKKTSPQQPSTQPKSVPTARAKPGKTPPVRQPGATAPAKITTKPARQAVPLPLKRKPQITGSTKSNLQATSKTQPQVAIKTTPKVVLVKTKKS